MNTEQFDGHTPGPWWIDEVSDNGHKDTWLMGNFPQDDMLLCMEFAESNEADVRLIAAAPDLLAEVKRLRRLNNYLWEHRSSHWSADDDAEMDRLEMIE